MTSSNSLILIRQRISGCHPLWRGSLFVFFVSADGGDSVSEPLLAEFGTLVFLQKVRPEAEIFLVDLCDGKLARSIKGKGKKRSVCEKERPLHGVLLLSGDRISACENRIPYILP